MIWLLVLGQITAFPQLGPFMLNARVQVQADKGRWHYTVCNDEKGFLVGLFQIEQIDVRKALVKPPVGWAVYMSPADNTVGFAADGADIRPGHCLGFEIRVPPDLEPGKVRYSLSALSEEVLNRLKTDPESVSREERDDPKKAAMNGKLVFEEIDGPVSK